MNPIYYCIALDDPGSPSFCTFAKNYFGTVFDIDQVMDRMARIGRYPDAVQAFAAFKDGDTEAVHTVCFHKEKLMNSQLTTNKQDRISNIGSGLQVLQCNILLIVLD